MAEGLGDSCPALCSADLATPRGPGRADGQAGSEKAWKDLASHPLGPVAPPAVPEPFSKDTRASPVAAHQKTGLLWGPGPNPPPFSKASSRVATRAPRQPGCRGRLPLASKATESPRKPPVPLCRRWEWGASLEPWAVVRSRQGTCTEPRISLPQASHIRTHSQCLLPLSLLPVAAGPLSSGSQGSQGPPSVARKPILQLKQPWGSSTQNLLGRHLGGPPGPGCAPPRS